MNTCTVETGTLRDLMQCVQAARDGAPPQSLFARQCDLVLELASHELPDIIVPRASDKNQNVHRFSAITTVLGELTAKCPIGLRSSPGSALGTLHRSRFPGCLTTKPSPFEQLKTVNDLVHALGDL